VGEFIPVTRYCIVQYHLSPPPGVISVLDASHFSWGNDNDQKIEQKKRYRVGTGTSRQRGEALEANRVSVCNLQIQKTATNAETSLNASPSAAGFLVGGISSGANFAGVIAYAARDAGLSPPITGLFVSIPVCILPQAYGLLSPEQRDRLRSLEQNAENPLLTGKSLGDIQGLLSVLVLFLIFLICTTYLPTYLSTYPAFACNHRRRTPVFTTDEPYKCQPSYVL